MLYINIASNVNILSDLVENNSTSKIIDKAYNPLLEYYEKSKVNSTLFFTGRTLEILRSTYPKTLFRFKKVINELGCVELGGHTYGHPVMPLIPTRDVEKHIEYSQEIEKEIFGYTAKGFLPPEWGYDVTIPYILKKYGINWTILLGAQIIGYYNQNQEDVFNGGIVQGVHNSNIPCVFVYDDPNLWFRNNLFNLFIGIRKPKEFAVETYNKIKPWVINTNKNNLIVFYFDLETISFNYLDGKNNDPCKNLDQFIEHFMEISGAKSISISDYITTKESNAKVIHPILTRTYKNFDIWYQGSQKLDLETKLVRELVWRADETIFDAIKTKKMWKEYLLSHSSDARAAASLQRAKGINISGKNIFFGKRERVIEAYNHLKSAKDLALGILNKHET